MIAFENASAAEVNPPADESSLEVTYINELYADEVTEEDLVSPKQARSPQTYATEEEVTYLSSYQEAGKGQHFFVQKVKTLFLNLHSTID